MRRRLVMADSGVEVIPYLELADSFWSRFKGLQLRPTLPPGYGLLLSPCSSLHTCFMRFPIDVVMLDLDGNVLGTKNNVRPWRLVFCAAGTRAVLETNVGATALPVGSRLNVD